MQTAVDTIEAEVRDLVRHRGLDPVQAPDGARELVEEVVADYGERVLTRRCRRSATGSR